MHTHVVSVIPGVYKMALTVTVILKHDHSWTNDYNFCKYDVNMHIDSKYIQRHYPVQTNITLNREMCWHMNTFLHWLMF